MRAFLLVLAATFLLAGCMGSGGSGPGGPRSTSGATTGPCQGARTGDETGSSPGLYAGADANQVDRGNRTLRWDLDAEAVCQAAGAVVTVQASTSEPLSGCPPIVYRASVTTGVTESEVALSGTGDLRGERTFQPQRPDLASGPASFVLSLSATLASNGFEPHDQECLEAALHSFALHSAYQAA